MDSNSIRFQVVGDIIQERMNHLERGFTVEQDDQLGHKSIAKSASAYALRASHNICPEGVEDCANSWDAGQKKTISAYECLKTAAALCIAAMESLKRKEEKGKGHDLPKSATEVHLESEKGN